LKNKIYYFLLKIADKILHHSKIIESKIKTEEELYFPKHNPNLKFIKLPDYIESEIETLLRENKMEEDSYNLKFLDVGGREGERKSFAQLMDYYLLDINPKIKGENIITADICAKNLNLNQDFDIIFSNNVFEHLHNPFIAAENCVKHCKENGLIIIIAPFSHRWHPCPNDYFRYSHQGLEHIFVSTNQVKTIFSGYKELSIRRKSCVGYDSDHTDRVPNDIYGGWVEHWMTVFIGKKINSSVNQGLK